MAKTKTAFYSILILVLISNVFYAAINKTDNRRFDVSSGGTLKLDTDKGTISIKTHSDETILVEVKMKAKTNDDDLAEQLFEKFEVDYSNNSNGLQINGEFTGSKSWLKNLFGNSKWNKLNVKFIITVPEKYNVDLRTSGGGITVESIVGNVVAKTSGGGLKFGNITGDIAGKTSGGGISVGECTGSIKINTSGGGINIDKCEGSVEAHTSGGGIKVNEVYGALNARTSGGPIYASIMEQPQKDCMLKTSGGGITVKLASNLDLNLDAKTSGGSVQCDLPLKMEGKVKSSKLKGEINDGGPQLYLRSSGGSISVEEN